MNDVRVDPSVVLASIDKDHLLLAVEKGFTEIVRLLLEDGRIDPTSNSSAALHMAKKLCHKDIVELIRNDARVFEK